MASGSRLSQAQRRAAGHPQVNVTLSNEEIARLTELAAELGASKSAVVGQAITELYSRVFAGKEK